MGDQNNKASVGTVQGRVAWKEVDQRFAVGNVEWPQLCPPQEPRIHQS